MAPPILIPLAMREKMRRMDERIRVIGLAVEWFERDEPKTLRKRARAWMTAWTAAAQKAQDAVIARWRHGELTTGQAVAAMDEELRKLAPRPWSLLGR